MIAEVRHVQAAVLIMLMLRSSQSPLGAPGRDLSSRNVVKRPPPTHHGLFRHLLLFFEKTTAQAHGGLAQGVSVSQDAAQAGHTLSVEMLSLSDGKLPSLSVDAMGEFQTESFRCESGFQLLLGWWLRLGKYHALL